MVFKVNIIVTSKLDLDFKVDTILLVRYKVLMSEYKLQTQYISNIGH